MTNGSRNLKRRFGPLVVALATTVGLMALAAPSASGATPVVSNYSGVGISEPNAIAVGTDGAMWFVNYLNNSIGRITTSGAVTNYTGVGISAPDAIAAGPDGALWFTNYGNNSIGRITTSGVVTNYTGTGIVHRTRSPPALMVPCGSPTSGTTRSGGSRPRGR